MKKVLILALVLLILASKTIAQTPADRIFYLNKSSQQDILLTGWLFHGGDSSEYVNPDFNDDDWKTIDPGVDINNFDPIKKTGIIWIRLHIKPGEALSHQQLAAWINQYTASQIYLNGKLLRQYGTIGAAANQTKANSPGHELFVLRLQSGADNVIAVRLGYQSGLPYLAPNFSPIPAFSMYVNSYPVAAANYTAYQSSIKNLMIAYTLFSGIFIIVSFINLIYYLYDKRQIVHLYYFIFCFSIAIACISSVPFFNNIADVTIQMYDCVLCCIANVIGDIFSTLVIYKIFEYRNRIGLKVLIAIGALSFAYVFRGGGLGFILCAGIFSAICMLEGVRVSIWAIKQHKKDAVIILPFIVSCIILTLWSSLLDETTLLSQVIGGLSFICLPVGMALYLGVQNAMRNQTLEASLNEVQLLSAQNLAHEQEKQQLLAQQNETLERQVTARTAELSQSLQDLKVTQNQLIQSEKMASLGELTAGIAHEIQNPLNFVNNFSEVNTEMIDELEAELKSGNVNEALSIAGEIRENEKKINHHGKRADFIVKGMLQHSRTSTGERQLTNLNVLADEFFKLSYHGLRAKDKNFNAELVTHFDPNLPKVNIVQQDIGRVLLNLFNNAFYAVNQKKKLLGVDYKPEVVLTTQSVNGLITITVKDNGVGIPENIKEKIMQPFFTTKPTGEGTGLGLSLSYDIIVKGHGGKIDVNSTAGEVTEFIVSLPLG